MSRDLDEKELLDDVFDTIRGYGRLATFHAITGGATYPWYITPPVEVRSLAVGGNEPEETHKLLVAAKGITFTPTRLMKMTDSKDSQIWRIIGADPIDSGLLTAAWRIRLAK